MWICNVYINAPHSPTFPNISKYFLSIVTLSLTILYEVFWARQHLRSLAPVMNEWLMMIMMAKWYSGTLGAQSFLTFVLQVRKNPEKTSPRKLVPTGDRTRVRCVTGAHASSWPTAMDFFFLTILFITGDKDTKFSSISITENAFLVLFFLKSSGHFPWSYTVCVFLFNF